MGASYSELRSEPVAKFMAWLLRFAIGRAASARMRRVLGNKSPHHCSLMDHDGDAEAKSGIPGLSPPAVKTRGMPTTRTKIPRSIIPTILNTSVASSLLIRSFRFAFNFAVSVCRLGIRNIAGRSLRFSYFQSNCAYLTASRAEHQFRR